MIPVSLSVGGDHLHDAAKMLGVSGCREIYRRRFNRCAVKEYGAKSYKDSPLVVSFARPFPSDFDKQLINVAVAHDVPFLNVRQEC